MTNFKVGQKVVYVGSDPDYPKKDFHVIKEIRKSQCGCRLEINCGYSLPPTFSGVRCHVCKYREDSKIFWQRSTYFRPLSYSSNVNMEVISLFQPTEERQDLKPQPKKIEA